MKKVLLITFLVFSLLSLVSDLSFAQTCTTKHMNYPTVESCIKDLHNKVTNAEAKRNLIEIGRAHV